MLATESMLLEEEDAAVLSSNRGSVPSLSDWFFGLCMGDVLDYVFMDSTSTVRSTEHDERRPLSMQSDYSHEFVKPRAETRWERAAAHHDELERASVACREAEKLWLRVKLPPHGKKAEVIEDELSPTTVLAAMNSF